MLIKSDHSMTTRIRTWTTNGNDRGGILSYRKVYSKWPLKPAASFKSWFCTY